MSRPPIIDQDFLLDIGIIWWDQHRYGAGIPMGQPEGPYSGMPMTPIGLPPRYEALQDYHVVQKTDISEDIVPQARVLTSHNEERLNANMYQSLFFSLG